MQTAYSRIGLGVIKPRPVLRCIAKCNRQYPNYFFEVIVYNNQDDLHKAFEWLSFTPDKEHGYKHLLAGCTEIRTECDNGKLVGREDCIGLILFSKDWLRVGCISHESTHAAMSFFRRIKKSVTLKNEELFATVVGNIARQIANKTKRLWKDDE